MYRKIAAFATFSNILLYKGSLKFQTLSKESFMCKIIIVPLKNVPIVAALPYKCFDLEETSKMNSDED